MEKSFESDGSSNKKKKFDAGEKLKRVRKFLGGDNDIVVTRNSVYEKKVNADGTFSLDSKDKKTGEARKGILDGKKYSGAYLEEGSPGILVRENGRVSQTSEIENLAVARSSKEQDQLLHLAVARAVNAGDRFLSEEVESGRKTLENLGYDLNKVKGQFYGPEGLATDQIVDQLRRQKR